MSQDIETKKKIVAEYPDITWEDFLRMEELRGRPIELIEDINKIPCEEISAPEILSAQPLVSVQMITYNHEKYIEEAINGVVNQQCKFPFELLIGEDCSTDRTREICLEYQKKYPHIIRVLFSQENVGASQNSRRVTLRTRGKYLAFCEGDDYWTDMNKLQMQVDVLEQHPDIGLVCTNYSVKQEVTGEFQQVMVSSDDGEDNLYQKVLYNDYFPKFQTAGVLIRTASYQFALKKEFIFRCSLECGDIQMFLQATWPKGKFMVIAQNTYVYRCCPTGASFGDIQYRLIVAGFLARCYYMLKVHKASSKDDVWQKFLLLALGSKILDNFDNHISNDHVPQLIKTMINHIGDNINENKFPLSVRMLQAMPIPYYHKHRLRPYVKNICRQMENCRIPLYSRKANKCVRFLPIFLNYYHCIRLHIFLLKIRKFLFAT